MFLPTEWFLFSPTVSFIEIMLASSNKTKSRRWTKYPSLSLQAAVVHWQATIVHWQAAVVHWQVAVVHWQVTVVYWQVAVVHWLAAVVHWQVTVVHWQDQKRVGE